MNKSALCITLALALSTAAAFGSPPAVQNKTPAEKTRTFDLGGGIKIEMVLIPAGQFMMGAPESDRMAESNEKPQHRVRISKPFYLGKYKVTQDQWEAVMGENRSAFRGPKYPVNGVNCDDCQKFIKKLNDKFPSRGGKFCLPTEAQWEYACRAGSTTPWCCGNDVSKLNQYAWYEGNNEFAIHPVGLKKPNAWGLYDMHGDLWEWCADIYDRRYYAISPSNDPTGPAYPGQRVLRGGSWNVGPNYARSSRRSWLGPTVGSFLHGFRLAMSSD
jgi:formylglycine-generating enzyme required for sulfatase activity